MNPHIISFIRKITGRLGAAVAVGVLLITVSYAPVASAQQAVDLKALYTNSPFYDPTSGSCTVVNATAPSVTSGSSVYILGDSITVRAQSAYVSKFQERGITANVDGSSSRGINGAGIDGNRLTGLAAIEADAAQVAEASAIVVALGTNGGDTAATIEQVTTALRTHNTKNAVIYWVDTIGIGGSTDLAASLKAANIAIYDNAPGVYTPISWYKTVAGTGEPQTLTGSETDPNGYIVNADQHVHPTPAGITALVNLVMNAVGGLGSNATAPTTANAGGCVCTVNVPTNLSGNDNIEKIYNFFLTHGLTPIQAAAFMGNIKAESGFNPALVEYGFLNSRNEISVSGTPTSLDNNVPPNRNKDGSPSDSSPADTVKGKDGVPGYGLVQWTAPGRKQALRDAVAASGKPASDLATQLEFLWKELTDPSYLGGYYNKLVYIPLLTKTTLVDATNLVLEKFEAPGDIAGQRGRRLVYATDIYNQFQAAPPTGSNTTVPATNGGCSSITPAGQATRFIDGFTIYSQYDPDWVNKPYGSSTIGASGCAPAALAMIITTLTGKRVTPIDTAAFATTQNMFDAAIQGSKWDISPTLAAHWGLKAELITGDVATISTKLRAGALIITSGRGGLPYTSEGHFIVIRGVTAAGKFKIGDSAHAATNELEWDPNQILTNADAGNFYAISK